MVSICELLINIVTSTEPKMMIGSTQKGKQSVNPFQRWGYTDKALPVNRQNLTYSNVNYVEHGKPISLLFFRGKQTVMFAEWGAGIRWRKKRMPSCNGMDRG